VRLHLKAPRFDLQRPRRTATRERWPAPPPVDQGHVLRLLHGHRRAKSRFTVELNQDAFASESSAFRSPSAASEVADGAPGEVAAWGDSDSGGPGNCGRWGGREGRGSRTLRGRSVTGGDPYTFGTSNDTELEKLKKRLQSVMYCIDCSLLCIVSKV
jgi:hypothetical protein